MKQHNNLHDLSAFDFPVKFVKGVRVGSAHDIGFAGSDDYGGVVRTDTSTVLAVHSAKYHLTTHVDVFKSTIEVLENAIPRKQNEDYYGLADDRFIIRDYVFNDGKQVMREIICRGIEVSGPDGHKLQFRIRQINSYDASSRYIMNAGIYREICSNGMGVFTSKISATSQKHTSKINIAAEQNKLKSAISSFYSEQDVWKGWYGTNVLTENVVRMFALTLVAEKGTDPHTGQPRYNKKQLSILTDAWERNSLQLGRNKWAAYQAATWWASHGEGKTRSAAEISLEREPKVLDMVKSEYWRNL